MNETNDKNSNGSPCPQCAARERIENSPAMYRGFPVREMITFPIGLAAQLLGLSRVSIWRKVRLGKLKMNSSKLISREELLRFAAEDAAASKACRRRRGSV
jgi:hypothetical protein